MLEFAVFKIFFNHEVHETLSEKAEMLKRVRVPHMRRK